VKGIPYLLVVESHDEGPRSGWRKTVKATVVPPIVERAAGLLVTGTLARDSMIACGAHSERVRVFANTIDVERFGDQVDRLAADRASLRGMLGAGDDDVVVLSVARLVREKGLDTLVRAVAAAGDSRLLLVAAGEGPQRAPLARWRRVGSARPDGDVEWERIVELYAAADVFALLLEARAWAVVVNEARVRASASCSRTAWARHTPCSATVRTTPRPRRRRGGAGAPQLAADRPSCGAGCRSRELAGTGLRAERGGFVEPCERRSGNSGSLNAVQATDSRL
jgi:glycosyltransferase involved in cell wall biosynthesis